MIPILYDSSEVDFLTNGLGSLSDVLSCTVTEEENGIYELEMEYPISGRHFSDLAIDRIIYAKPNEGSNNPNIISRCQPFDIYKITKPINGVVTVSARHVSYRTKYIPMLPVSIKSEDNSSTVEAVSNTFNTASNFVESLTNFSFSLDGVWRKTSDEYTFKEPRSFKECLVGRENSFVGIFDCDLEYDHFSIHATKDRGKDNNVRIAYSKNLTDLTHTEDATDHVTGVFPYWQKNDDSEIISIKTYKENESGIVYSSFSSWYPYKKTIAINAKDEYEEMPTEENLRDYARKYIEENSVGKPSTTIKVSFAALWQTEEYKNIAVLEKVRLCDKVQVEYRSLGIRTTLKVISTVYDVISERYTSIVLGDSKDDIATTVADLQFNQITKAVKRSEAFLEQELQDQYELINGFNGGHIEFERDANSNPIAMLIKSDEVNPTWIIKMNAAGIGFSSDGGQTFNSAWTIKGRFDGQYIGANTIEGSAIKADTIKSGDIRVESKDERVSYVQNKELSSIPEWKENTFYWYNYSTKKYILTTSKPGDWDNWYTDYYTAVKPVFGDLISIGFDPETSKPTIILRASDSTVKLVETNDRLSFIEMTIENGIVTEEKEVAYISDKRFYAPNMTIKDSLELNGYSISRFDGPNAGSDGNGIVFRWIGG